MVLGVAIPAWSQAELPEAEAQSPEQPRATLRVVQAGGAEDCPNAIELAHQVNAVAGAPTVRASSGPSPLRLTVWLGRDGSGYHAQIQAVGAIAGVRTIADSGSDCVGLTSALAVSIALMVDEAGTIAAAEPVVPSVSQTRAPPRPRLRLVPNLTAGVAFGVLPRAAPVLGLELELGAARWHGGLGWLWMPERQWEVQDLDVRGRWWSVSLLGCYTALWQRGYRPRFSICVHSLQGVLG